MALLAVAMLRMRPWTVDLSGFRGGPLVLAVGLALLVYVPVRALRWRLALKNSPPFTEVVFALYESFLASTAIGFGTGDVVRVARLRRENPSFVRDFGGSLAERAAELVSLALLVLLAAAIGFVPRWTFVIGGGAILIYLIFLGLGPRLLAVIERRERWPRLALGLASLLEASTPWTVVGMTALTLAGWAVELVILHIALDAFGLPSGFATALMIVIGINVTIAIPGPPMNLGTFEAGVVAALAVQGVPTSLALAFALGYHLLLSVPANLTGAVIYFARGGSRQSGPSKAPVSAPPLLRLAARYVYPEHVLLVLFSSVLLGLRWAYGPQRWHGLHSFTITTGFGTMVGLCGMAFVTRAPQLLHRNVRAARMALTEALTSVREWLPFVLCAVVYENLNDATNLVRPESLDGVLSRMDQALFGVQPTLWLEQHVVTPLLTDWMSLAYALYFFFPAALLLVAYTRRDERRFRIMSLALLLAFYLGFVGFILVPAIGPRYWMRDAYRIPVLSGRYFRGNASEIFAPVEAVLRDCFPSLHTAISTVALAYAYVFRSILPGGRLWFWVFLPLIASLWISTVYLRQHWVMDVFGGWLLAALCVWLSPRLVDAYLRLRARVEPQAGWPGRTGAKR